MIHVGIVLAAFRTSAAEEWVKFISQPESKVEFNGGGTLHDWKIYSTVVHGSLEAGPDFPTQPSQPFKAGKAQVRGEVAMPVHSLTNGSPTEARWARSLLQVEKHPVIRYHLEEMRLKTLAAPGQTFYEADTTGTLTIAGVTNKISLPVRIEILAERRLKLSGSATVLLSDYQLEPYVLRDLKDGRGNFLPDIKSSRDDVGLVFEWMVAETPAEIRAK